jgi:hypothetical protein
MCGTIRCDEGAQVGNNHQSQFYLYKVVQIWPGLFVCKQVTVCPGHIWTTLCMG